uniref:Carbohydrate kinase FGGY N-terminal domain-containing protein n=1 Tax=Salarias fasciatus TaxID=181472 RepID=A0A672IPB2_SALFA
MAEVFYVGVDVGTASVRAALVTRGGALEATAQEPIVVKVRVRVTREGEWLHSVFCLLHCQCDPSSECHVSAL